jgi:hypothetical protein
LKTFSAGILFCLAGLLQAADPLEFSVGAFAFERPVGWRWVVPSSTMRKAQLNVPGSGEEFSEVTFFHFGQGQGGGIQANVGRWFSQFQDAQTGRHEEKINGIRVVFVTAEGTFLSGTPGGPLTPKSGYGLRGAILEHPSSGDVFVKMTGPAALVVSASKDFDAMVSAAANSLTR